MKKVMIVCFLWACSGAVAASTITAVSTGSWLSTSTWSCGCLPTGSDNIVIPHGINVTVTIPGVALNNILTNITVTVNGTLTIISSAVTLDNSDVMRINPGGTIVAGGLGGSVFSGLSNIALSPGASLMGPATITNGTLPVTLLYFKAEVKGTSVMLTWASASEKNFDYYELERSTDGNNFSSLGRVDGAGTSTTRLNYALTDESPIAGRSYYRLRAIDLDKTQMSFKLLMVDFNTNALLVNIYPNPVKGHELKFDATIPGTVARAALHDGKGNLIGYWNAVPGENNVRLPETIDAGIYFLRINVDGKMAIERVVVE